MPAIRPIPRGHRAEQGGGPQGRHASPRLETRIDVREEPVHTTNDRQSEAQTDTLAPSDDPVFREEQLHLSDTYAKLQEIGRELVRKMERTRAAAAADKRSMSEELAPNFATYADAMETYADFAAMNRVIDGLQPRAGRRRGEACERRAFAQAALLREGGPPVQARSEAQRALHRHGGHRRRVVPPPRRGLALPCRGGVLQPGHRPHVVRGRRAHHRRGPQAAPPVRHRRGPPERLLRHHRGHPGFASARVALEAPHGADAGHHGHHPEGAEPGRAP